MHKWIAVKHFRDKDRCYLIRDDKLPDALDRFGWQTNECLFEEVCYVIRSMPDKTDEEDVAVYGIAVKPLSSF